MSQEEIAKPSRRAARTWSDYSALRWSGSDRPKSNIGKVALANFAQNSGLPYLKVIATFGSAKDILIDDLPDHFVLKPTSLWSGLGVMLLHRVSALNLWYDAKSGQLMSHAEIFERCNNLESRIGNTVAFMAEERALDEDPDIIIPIDYKIFTFHGVTKFVLQVDRNYNPPRMAFFDGEFEPIVDNRVFLPEGREETRGTHRKPRCASDLLDLARRVTLTLNGAFISVDCYATLGGPILGELTHTPGGPWYRNMYAFSDEFELELGEAWRAANQRLNLPEALVKVPYEVKMKMRVTRVIE